MERRRERVGEKTADVATTRVEEGAWIHFWK
jgi:hypothetical protein